MPVLILLFSKYLITLITLQLHHIRDPDDASIVVENKRFVRNALHAPHNTTARKFSIHINETIIVIGWDDFKNLNAKFAADMSCMMILLVIFEEHP